MNLLQGIQLHELILMILGFILGLALIFIFIYTALRSKPNLKLLYGFFAPLVMIGYPSIRSMEFGKDVVKIEKLVEKVNENPTDVQAQKELISNLEQLPASRCKTSVDAMTTIANAQASLGLYDSAKVTIQKAVELDKNSPKATQSQKDIHEKWRTHEEISGHVRRIEHNLEQINRRPNDKSLRDSLAFNLREVEHLSNKTTIHLENQQVISVARAAAVTGQKEQAEVITDEVLKVSPNQVEATNLKKDIRDKKYHVPEKFRPKPSKPITRENNRADNIRKTTVPAPAPVFQDTAKLSIRLYPRSVEGIKIWNIKE